MATPGTHTLNHSLFLFQLLAVIGLGIGVIALFRRLHLPTLLGYLAVGFSIQVIGTEVFHDFNQLQYLAKYGVAFLLFTIGLEFSLEKLLTMRKAVFLFGSLQVFICAFIFWLTLFYFVGSLSAFILAFAFAFSSTALISKHLSESNQLQTHAGYASIAVLIFQDMLVVPLIIITTTIGQHGGFNGLSSFSYLGGELLRGLLTFCIIMIAAKFIFNPLLHEVAKARSREVFLLAVLFIALSATTFSEVMGMSMELGAFLAGVMLGGSQYHHQVEIEIRPFRDILLGLFFIGIGSMIDLNLLPRTIWWMLLCGFSIVFIKAVIIGLISRKTLKDKRQDALRISLLLCQGSEFGFVLVAIAGDFNIVHSFIGQVAIGSIILSMIFSLLFMRLERPLLNLLKRWWGTPEEEQPHGNSLSQMASFRQVKPDVLIVGFGRVGQQLAKILTPKGILYTAIDLDPLRVKKAQLAGDMVLYGDATDSSILTKAKFEQAKLVLLTCSEIYILKKIIQQIQQLDPKKPILARSLSNLEAEDLRQLGVKEVIVEPLEASITLGAHTLISLGVDVKEVTSWCESIRKDHYHMLSGYFAGGPDNTEALTEALENQFVLKIGEHSGLQNKTLYQLCKQFSGLHIHSLKRNDLLCTDPDLEATLEPGDVIVYSASKEVTEALTLMASQTQILL